MKKRITYLIKNVVALFLLAITIITTAYVWPTSKLQTPIVYEKTIIKNINIVDVVTGEIAEDQFVLIEQSRITKIDSTNIATSEDALFKNQVKHLFYVYTSAQ